MTSTKTLAAPDAAWSLGHAAGHRDRGSMVAFDEVDALAIGRGGFHSAAIAATGWKAGGDPDAWNWTRMLLIMPRFGT